MNIPKHLIVDLLPLYLADEVSEETREPYVLFGLAAFFWTGFYMVNRKIGD